MNASAALARPTALLLTDDRRLRTSLTVMLTSVLSYLLYSLIGAMQVAAGTMTLGWLLVGALGGISINIGFYGLVRLGYTRNLKDPTLGPLQLGVGVLFMYLTYATSGPAAPATLIILASHVVYAMFAFPVRQLWRAVAGVLAGLGLTMLLSHHIDPLRYPAHLQWIGFLYACLVMPLIASLGNRLARLNERLQSQRAELRAALDKVQQMAIRDELTQSYNRRHMADLIALQRSHHHRNALPLTVALLDIDHFKQVNDRLGHAAGDAVLQRFAALASRLLRGGDLLSRWGGEEFLVLLPATRCDDAALALERLREALADEDFSDLDADLRVTFSAGLTAIAPDDSDAAAIERADRAMYRAKNGGRNRTVVH